MSDNTTQLFDGIIGSKRGREQELNLLSKNPSEKQHEAFRVLVDDPSCSLAMLTNMVYDHRDSVQLPMVSMLMYATQKKHMDLLWQSNDKRLKLILNTLGFTWPYDNMKGVRTLAHIKTPKLIDVNTRSRGQFMQSVHEAYTAALDEGVATHIGWAMYNVARHYGWRRPLGYYGDDYSYGKLDRKPFDAVITYAATELGHSADELTRAMSSITGEEMATLTRQAFVDISNAQATSSQAIVEAVAKTLCDEMVAMAQVHWERARKESAHKSAHSRRVFEESIRAIQEISEQLDRDDLSDHEKFRLHCEASARAFERAGEYVPLAA